MHLKLCGKETPQCARSAILVLFDFLFPPGVAKRKMQQTKPAYHSRQKGASVRKVHGCTSSCVVDQACEVNGRNVVAAAIVVVDGRKALNYCIALLLACRFVLGT